MRRFVTLCAGISGWIVHEDKMDEWKRRRQNWFMKGKEGRSVSMNGHAPFLHPASNGTTDPGGGTRRTYKPTSFYQLLRRLGFFPTETTKRATHGLDFEGSRTFKWNGSRRQKYIQSKKEKENVSRTLGLEIGNGRHSVVNVSGPVIPAFEMGRTFDIGLHSVITSEPGMPQVPLATQVPPTILGSSDGIPILTNVCSGALRVLDADALS
jgi:hypothetical protein